MKFVSECPIFNPKYSMDVSKQLQETAPFLIIKSYQI